MTKPSVGACGKPVVRVFRVIDISLAMDGVTVIMRISAFMMNGHSDEWLCDDDSRIIERLPPDTAPRMTMMSTDDSVFNQRRSVMVPLQYCDTLRTFITRSQSDVLSMLQAAHDQLMNWRTSLYDTIMTHTCIPLVLAQVIGQFCC